MASQATHVILTELVFDAHFSHFDKRDFIVGTLFPDIRYLKVIERAETHIEGVRLADVKEEPNAFVAGMKFHNLVDNIREEFVSTKKIYELCPEFKYITQSIKLLEDERYYPLFSDWPRAISYLDGILDGERRYAIPTESLEKWHHLLREYFEASPTDQSRERFIQALGFSSEDIYSINAQVSELRKDEKVVQIIDEFIRVFPELLKQETNHYE